MRLWGLLVALVVACAPAVTRHDYTPPPTRAAAPSVTSATARETPIPPPSAPNVDRASTLADLFEIDCIRKGGATWAAERMAARMSHDGATCPEPPAERREALRLEADEAAAIAAQEEATRRAGEADHRERAAVRRRASAAHLDAWALEHGDDGDAVTTETDVEADDVLLFEKRFGCSRQVVFRIERDSRDTFAALGFRLVKCCDISECWWQPVGGGR
jgi:hypothetical protein